MSEPSKRLFEVVIVQEGKDLIACISSCTDGKRRVEQSRNMTELMDKVKRAVKVRAKLVKNFPIIPAAAAPEPSRIILPGQPMPNGNKIRLVR